jgi:predicted transglutaminase-like cysteine proteinase
MMEVNMPRTTDSKAMLFVAFVLTLGAGLAGGMLVSRFRSAPTTAVSAPQSPLDELQLTADQTAQMRRIWEAVRNSAQECEMRGNALRLQRDKAMEGLLSDNQKARFEKVNLDYNAQVQAMDAQREAGFQQAVSATEQMLTAPQREKYLRILREKTGREPGQPLLIAPPSLPGPVSKAAAGALMIQP